MIATASDLIDELGGNTAVAGLMRVKLNSVSNWRLRGFPPWTHAKLRQAAESACIHFDPDLFEARPRGRAA